MNFNRKRRKQMEPTKVRITGCRDVKSNNSAVKEL
jgi:hypothetical protein